MENRAAVTYVAIVAIIAIGFSYAFVVTYRPATTTGAEGSNIVACEYSVTEGYSQESVILKGNSTVVDGGSFWPITTIVTTFTSTSDSTAVVGYVTTLTTPRIQVCSYVHP
ncbi:MAG TPA: hypothetical protein VEB87_03275 [Nitrososphaerales archaeon]|nr:hypothetical protein [Nitrososphaerales archaeon]